MTDCEDLQTPASARGLWWHDAVIYEVYLRSFCDASGDGVGDLPGLLSKLGHISALGADGLWITPWYPSPMKDGGYDIKDYVGIDPLFGTLDDARQLVDEAHRRGLKVIVDFVANHTSSEHPWFVEALTSPPGSAARGRYHFADGRGPSGVEPPNDWISAFGGPAWTRATARDGTPGQWYLHLFDPSQPDLNWDDAGVRADFAEILAFWFDFGLDGLRVDAASGFAKERGLPDHGFIAEDIFQPVTWEGAPLWDVEGVHDIFREWRRISDRYEGDRAFVGEVVVNGPERLARYMRPDELHTTFNLDFLKAPLEAGALRRVIDSTLAAFAEVGAPATWTLSNHDEIRHVTRFGRQYTGVPAPRPWPAPPCDVDLGTRRARAMLLLMLALPGSVYLYQGEELGLWEVEDLADDALEDPVWERSGHTVRGRDGCRVPMPWTRESLSCGFSPEGSKPWLPQPASWAGMSVEAQTGRPDSMLELYRRALSLRRLHVPDDSVALTWRDAPPDVLDLARGSGHRCVLNLSEEPYPLGSAPLLASDGGTSTVLAPDVAAWMPYSVLP